MTAKSSKRQHFPNFNVLAISCKIIQKIDWLGFGIHTTEKQEGVWCVLDEFPSGMGCNYSKSFKTFLIINVFS